MFYRPEGEIMKRIITIGACAIALLAGTASTQQAEASYAPSAGDVARAARLMDPTTCPTIREAIPLLGYHSAEAIFAEGYGYGKHPSARAVFRALVRQCHA